MDTTYQSYIDDRAIQIINDPMSWRTIIDMTTPKEPLDVSNWDDLLIIINRYLPVLMYCEAINSVTGPSISDYSFLSIMGTQKQWKHECPICWRDLHRFRHGIIMFRPCGHVVCVKCFKQWFMRYSDHTIASGCLNILGHSTYINLSSIYKPDSLDLSIQCPSCRTCIDRVFRTEYATMSDTEKVALEDLINVYRNHISE